ncbi:lipopolysaccharide biosynthesis protein [Bacillus cereus]|uniref:oligosaccharide flippase family protein n=1 Tax=Bacillus paranthracis TaxID=2026186 RepID=UPI0002B8DA85|nr:oligosaccharide flippase family protein [Bacillus paranthracis]RGO17489.1 lipopolysaccharide biosynthesis protein [Bacillus cereus]
MEKQQRKALSLKANFSWSFLSNLIYSASQWGILSVIAKLGSPSMVGLFTLGLAVTAPVVLFAGLQLRVVLVTDARNQYSFGNYLTTRTLINGLTILLMILMVLFIDYDALTRYIILIVGMYKIVELTSELIYGYFQKNERNDIIAYSKIIKGIISVISVGFLLFITKNLLISLIGMVLSNLLVLIFYEYRIVKKEVGRTYEFNTIKIKSLVISAIPLGIVLMLSSLVTNIPRYILEREFSAKELGFFAAMTYLFMVGTTFISALGQVVTPRLSKNFASGNKKEFIKITAISSLFGLVIGLISILVSFFFGREILSILYTKEYGVYSDYLTLLMVSATINYAGSLIGYSITAAREFRIQPFLGLIWVVSTTSISLVIIPKMGLYGAVWALILSSIVQFITKLIVFLYVINTKMKKGVNGG